MTCNIVRGSGLLTSKILLSSLFSMIFLMFSSIIPSGSATNRTFYEVWNINGKCGIHTGNKFPDRIAGWASRYTGPPQPNDYHKAALYLAEQHINAINIVAHVSGSDSFYTQIQDFLAALEQHSELTKDIKVILDLEPNKNWGKKEVEDEVKKIIDNVATKPADGFYSNVVGISLDMEWMQDVPVNQKTATLESLQYIIVNQKKLKFFPIWWRRNTEINDRAYIENMALASKSGVIPVFDGKVDRDTETFSDGSNVVVDCQVKYMKNHGFDQIGVLPIAKETGTMKKKNSVALKTWRIYKHAIESTTGVDYVLLGSGLAYEDDPIDIYTTKPILDTGWKKSSVVVQYCADTFFEGEQIYVFGSTEKVSTTLFAFVVVDTSWYDGKVIPARVLGTEQTVATDDSGKIILPRILWNRAVLGSYDVVIDVNGNGKYDEGIDALDDNDGGSAGFHASYYDGSCNAYVCVGGGIVVSVDRLVLLAPYIGLASTILVATVATTIYVKRVKLRKENQ